MRKMLKKLNRFLNVGINYASRALILSDYFAFRKMSARNPRFTALWKDLYPQVREKTKTTSFDRHYVYHTAWAARKVREIHPSMHVDVASSLYFCTIISAFVPVRFYDYRPPLLELPNLEVLPGDLMKLPFRDGEVSSLSCMHTVEHVGLGRYGDPIDPDGDLKAIQELKRVLAPGGSLLFVTPVGKPKVMFNAHRIYSFSQIMEYFSDLELKEFSLIPEFSENGIGIITHATRAQADRENYGCGCFWFMKKR